MYAHLGAGTVIVAAIIAITRVTTNLIRLIAFVLDDDKRWPHFRNLALFVIFLLLAIAIVAGWWLFRDGGHGILRDFGPVRIAKSRAAS